MKVYIPDWNYPDIDNRGASRPEVEHIFATKEACERWVNRENAGLRREQFRHDVAQAQQWNRQVDEHNALHEAGLRSAAREHFPHPVIEDVKLRCYYSVEEYDTEDEPDAKRQGSDGS